MKLVIDTARISFLFPSNTGRPRELYIFKDFGYFRLFLSLKLIVSYQSNLMDPEKLVKDQKTFSIQQKDDIPVRNLEFKVTNQPIQLNPSKQNIQAQSKYFKKYAQALLEGDNHFQNSRMCQSLLANGIKIKKGSVQKQKCLIQIVDQNSQSFKIVVNLRGFRLELNIIQIDSQSPIHRHICVGTGSSGKVYMSEILNKKYAFKCFEFQRSKNCSLNDLANQSKKLKKIIHQYCITKILSIIGVGVRVQNISGFDLYVYYNCIQFGMDYHEKPKIYSPLQKQLLSQLKSSSSSQISQKDFEYLNKNDLYQKLRKMHALNIVHRDIKPENMIYDQLTRKWVFCDFGSAQNIRENPGQLLFLPLAGTFGYIIPEFYSLLKQNIPVDLYYNDLYAFQKTIQQIRLKHYVDFQSQNNRQIEYYQKELLQLHLSPQNNAFQSISECDQNQNQQIWLRNFFTVLKIKNIICQGSIFQLKSIQNDKQIINIMKRQRQAIKKLLRQSSKVSQKIYQQLQKNQLITIFEDLDINPSKFLLTEHRTAKESINSFISTKYYLQNIAIKNNSCQQELDIQSARIQNIQKIFESGDLNQAVLQNLSLSQLLLLYIDSLWSSVFSRIDLKIKSSNILIKILQHKKQFQYNQSQPEIKNPFKLSSMQSIYICLEFTLNYFISKCSQIETVIKTIVISLIIFREKKFFFDKINEIQRKYDANQLILAEQQLQFKYLKQLPYILQFNVFQIARRDREFVLNLPQNKDQKLNYFLHEQTQKQRRERNLHVTKLLIKKRFNNQSDFQKAANSNILLFAYQIVIFLTQGNFPQLKKSIDKYKYSNSKLNDNIFDSFKIEVQLQSNKAAYRFQKLGQILQQAKKIIKQDDYLGYIYVQSFLLNEFLSIKPQQAANFIQKIFKQNQIYCFTKIKIVNGLIYQYSRPSISQKEMILGRQAALQNVFKIAKANMFCKSFLIQCKQMQRDKKLPLILEFAKFLVAEFNFQVKYRKQNIENFLKQLQDFQGIGNNQVQVACLRGFVYEQREQHDQAIKCFEEVLKNRFQFFIDLVLFKLFWLYFTLEKNSQLGFYYLKHYVLVCVRQQNQHILRCHQGLSFILSKLIQRQFCDLIFQIFRLGCVISFRSRQKQLVKKILKINEYFMQKANEKLKYQVLLQISDTFRASRCVQQSNLCLIMYELVTNLKISEQDYMQQIGIMLFALDKSSFQVRKHILNTYFKRMRQLCKVKRKKRWLLNMTTKYSKVLTIERNYCLKNYKKKQIIDLSIANSMERKIIKKFT